MTIINKRLINYILIDKRLNEHFGQICIDFWSLEITEIKFEIRNQLEIKLISKSRTRFQQVSDPSGASQTSSLSRALPVFSFYSLIYSLYRYRSLHLSLSSLSIAASESVIHATCGMVDRTSLIWRVRNLCRFIVRAWLTLPALYGVSVIFAASLFVHG